MEKKNVTISTTELVESVIVVCGGIAFTDICKNAVKQVPHGNGIFKKIGRAALYCGSFAVGANIAGKAVSIYDTAAKSIDKCKKAWDEGIKKSEADNDSEAEGEFEEEETSEASDDIFNYEED